MEKTKMPNLRNDSKGGFEPGLPWLRVRRSTAELLRSTIYVQILNWAKKKPYEQSQENVTSRISE